MVKNSKQIFSNGTTHEGGVLLTVLGLLLVFSLLFTFRLQSHQFENQMRYQVQEYYTGKSLRNLAVATILTAHSPPQGSETITGELTYNVGTVAYVFKSDAIALTIELSSGKIMNEVEVVAELE